MKIDSYKYIYFIGVGGIGMSALARYFKAKGKYVAGYDKVNSALCVTLAEEGIEVFFNDDVLEIPEQIKTAKEDELLVVYTPAISSDNKLLQFFKNKGLSLYKRAQVLGMISEDCFTIAVAGTHGKTTTTAILAHILQHTEQKATAFLGGISRNYNTNLLLAEEGDILIVEADEYDRSFLHLKADVAIITSVDADHLDIYETETQLKDAFVEFAAQLKPNGVLIVEQEIAVSFPVPEDGKLYKYSAKGKSDFYADNIKVVAGRMNFDYLANNGKKLALELVLPGVHNVSNAIAALSVASFLGLSSEQIVEAMASFKGINRRFDVHINTADLAYIDDYAHHPKEVSATINAAKQLFPKREITVVFQPHLFSRTQDFANDFASSLSLADQLILLDIYPARELPIKGVDAKMLLNLCSANKQELCKKEGLLSNLRDKDLEVLITLGAGDIGTLVEPIKQILN